MEGPERARRAGAAALVWARRLLVGLGTAIGAFLGFAIGLLSWLLGADGVAVLGGLLVGAGVGYLLTQIAVAHGHRLAPLALWAAERRTKGVGTAAIAIAILRRLLDRGRAR